LFLQGQSHKTQQDGNIPLGLLPLQHGIERRQATVQGWSGRRGTRNGV